MSLKIKEKTIRFKDLLIFENAIKSDYNTINFISEVKNHKKLYWNPNLEKFFELCVLMGVSEIQPKLKKICKQLNIKSIDLLLTLKNLQDNCTFLFNSDNEDDSAMEYNSRNIMYFKYAIGICLYTNELIYGYDVGFSGENVEQFVSDIKYDFIPKIDKSLAHNLVIDQVKECYPEKLDYFKKTGDLIRIPILKNTLTNMLVNGAIIKSLLPKLLGDKYPLYESNIKFKNSLLGNELFYLHYDRLFISPTKIILNNLRRRGVIIPKNGLGVIDYSSELYNDIKGWSNKNFDIFETIYNDCNFLIVINISQNFSVTIINLTQGSVYSQDLDVDSTLKLLVKLYNIDSDEFLCGEDTYQLINLTKQLYIPEKTIQIQSRDPNIVNMEVTSPYYWKYRGNNPEPNNKSVGTHKFFGKTIKVGTYVRTLQDGHKRSKEATNLAKLYCLDLEDNETVVSGFDRQYRKDSVDIATW